MSLHRPKTRTPLKPATSKELAAKCESNPDALRVSREEPVFQKIGLKAKVDLFVGYIDRVTIYEAKAGKTKALDLYQLRMYVDGCALDNKPVDEAILIARYHPPEVRGSCWTSSMGCPRLMAVPTISGWSHGMRRASSCSRARD